jgi:hypothetical protein
MALPISPVVIDFWDKAMDMLSALFLPWPQPRAIASSSDCRNATLMQVKRVQFSSRPSRI